MHMLMDILDLCKCTWLSFLFFSLTCFSLFCTWSLGGEWPLSPLGNNLLLRSELIHIHEWWVYFPRPSHRSISLKFGRELAQVLDSTALAHCKLEARYVPLQVLMIILLSWTWSYMHILYALMNMLHIIL